MTKFIALCSSAMGSGKSAVAETLIEEHGFMLIKFAGTLKRMISRLLLDLGYDGQQVADMIDGRDKERDIPYFDVVLRGQAIDKLLVGMLREMLTDLAIPDRDIDDMIYLSKFKVPIDGLGVSPQVLLYALNKWMLDCVLFRPSITPRWLQQSLGTEWGRDMIRSDLWVTIAKLKVRAYQVLGGGRDIVIDDMRFINEYEAVIELGGVPVRIVRPGAVRTTAPHPSEGALDDVKMQEIQNDGTLDDLIDEVSVLLAPERLFRL